MWIWSEDHSAMVNLDHCFLLVVRRGDEDEWFITAHRDRGDMGTAIKTFGDSAQAEDFLNKLCAAANARPAPKMHPVFKSIDQ